MPPRESPSGSPELPSSPPYPAAVRLYLPKIWPFNAAASPVRASSPVVRPALPEIEAFNDPFLRRCAPLGGGVFSYCPRSSWLCSGTDLILPCSHRNSTVHLQIQQGMQIEFFSGIVKLAALLINYRHIASYLLLFSCVLFLLGQCNF
uniref:Uncharacterized protein n=1 Tax=Ananas comosus var. bracteatus TaxID=296719 RepID=A0A6V7PLT8_ANACO|nr:unnamed protein product [Ananas comosus var. bracteatus]